MKFELSAYVALLVTLFSWMAEAFEMPTLIVKRQFTRTSQFYRSISGLLSASSTSLSSMAGGFGRQHDAKMISIDHQSLRQSPFALVQSWMPWTGSAMARAVSFQTVAATQSTGGETISAPSEEQLQNAKSHLQNHHRVRKHVESGGDASHLRGMHVAGFMDYDPKIAARTVYKQTTTSLRRDNSWFSM